MSPQKKNASKTPLGTLIALAVVLVIGLGYTLLGSDPLGLMGGTATVTQVSSTVARATKAPAQKTPTKAIPTETVPAAVEPTALSTPEAPSASWWQVYFVNSQKLTDKQAEEYGGKGLPPQLYKGSITEKLIEHIDAAKTTIHIASFETDLVDVANALIRAKERGVDVRWITDDQSGIAADTKPGHGQFKLMKAAGIEVIDDHRGALMHDKFWLFDGQTVWTGSTNVTISGMFEQNNNVIVIDSPELAAIYESQWADMWSGKFNARAPSTVDQQKLTIDGSAIQILFSPEDKAISHIVPYIQNASKSIYFMAFTFTNADLGNAMLEKAKNGVAVSGVFEKTGSDTDFSQMPPLFCAKVPVRQDGNPAFLHHKVIVIDERYVVTGSLNFTDNADQSNNENVIIIDNPTIAKLYVEEFQRVWGAASDPDPAKIKCK
jgi:phosphatidylserine/phosphatidylglycerophosphate/cardiolipin synthase-like enzyme